MAVIHRNRQLVLDKIELHFEGALFIRNGRGRESPSIDIQRDLPPMIDMPG